MGLRNPDNLNPEHMPKPWSLGFRCGLLALGELGHVPRFLPTLTTTQEDARSVRVRTRLAQMPHVKAVKPPNTGGALHGTPKWNPANTTVL